MTGVSDLPFRRLAHALEAGLVVSEMVASAELIASRPMSGAAPREVTSLPMLYNSSGCDPPVMEKRRESQKARAPKSFDINMGCPAREVTGKASGKRTYARFEPCPGAHRCRRRAVTVPVTLKMRLGWDEASRNAPELAHRAEEAGIRLVTVHGARATVLQGSRGLGLRAPC